jgi:hypothetical protein
VHKPNAVLSIARPGSTTKSEAELAKARDSRQRSALVVFAGPSSRQKRRLKPTWKLLGGGGGSSWVPPPEVAYIVEEGFFLYFLVVFFLVFAPAF